jgi:hypothetical protein
MLAYECGLRRLRSGRVAHRLSDYNRHIAYGSIYLGLFTINNHTHRVFDYLKNVFYIFILFSLFFFKIKLHPAQQKKHPRACVYQKKVVSLQPK